MDGFTVWYVLVVVFADNEGLHSMTSPKLNLEACEHDAQRAIAALSQNSARWACHEMTVETKGSNVFVNFPNN